MIEENLRWLLSYYRASELDGALFFARLARAQAPGRFQTDLTRHFAEEGMHAWYWTSCLDRLGASPLRVEEAYQDRYLANAGLPVNLMEVLAITLVFEQRVIGLYALHGASPDTPGPVKETLDRIMVDEKSHIRWVSAALRELGEDYGEAAIEATLKRFRAADQEVYARTLDEHADRISHLRRQR